MGTVHILAHTHTRAHPRACSCLALTAHPGQLLVTEDTSGSSQEPRSSSDIWNSRTVPVSRHSTFSFPRLLGDSAPTSRVSRKPLFGRTAREAAPNGGFGHKSLDGCTREGSVSYTLFRASQRPGSRGQAVPALACGAQGKRTALLLKLGIFCVAAEATGMNSPWGWKRKFTSVMKGQEP